MPLRLEPSQGWMDICLVFYEQPVLVPLFQCDGKEQLSSALLGILPGVCTVGIYPGCSGGRHLRSHLIVK